MAIELKSLVKVIENSYGAYYNIISEGLPSDLPLDFKAEYFRNVKKQRLWESEPTHECETDEYVYVFSRKAIDAETVDKCIRYALDDGLSKVNPRKGLKSSDVNTVFVADEFTEDALKMIKHNDFKKSYNHGFHGTSSLIASAVDVNDEKVTVNAYGSEMARYFRKLFAAQHRE